MGTSPVASNFGAGIALPVRVSCQILERFRCIAKHRSGKPINSGRGDIASEMSSRWVRSSGEHDQAPVHPSLSRFLYWELLSAE